MDSVNAKACDSSIQLYPVRTEQVNGSRNKRKFRADQGLTNPDNINTEPQNECTCYEPSNACYMCNIKQGALKDGLGLARTSAGPSDAGSKEEVEANKTFHDADWSELSESELEELALSILDANFKSAIKKIIAFGYSEEIATKAVLKRGLCYGFKDAVSNIVDNTLPFLKSGQDIDTMMQPHFENLQEKENYILAELVCVVKAVKPFYSIGDAMWRLLICDMNVSYACAAKGNSSTSNMPPLPKKEAKAADSNLLKPVKPNSSVSSVPTEEKFLGSRKVISKREHTLRQKCLHSEKHHTCGSKGGSRAGKLTSYGGLVLDEKLKSVGGSTAVNAENRFNFGKATGNEIPQDNSDINFSTNICFSSVPAFKQELDSAISTSPKSNIQSSSHGVNTLPVLPPADTELSLSVPAKSSSDPSPVTCNSEADNAVPLDKSLPQLIPHDKRDEIIQSLVSQVRESENQLQQWTDWTNHKIMEAASILGQDKAELKALRKEKEAFERIKKEKQTWEENTAEKLSTLEAENVILRMEMEDTHLHAADAAAKCQEVLRREKTILMKCQSWEKQKPILQEELLACKQMCEELQKKLEYAIAWRDQFEERYAVEKRLEEEALTLASSFKKEKEEIEASVKCKEDSMKLKEESHMLKHKADLQRLEKEILQLRLETDSSEIAALRKGIEGRYKSKLRPTLTDSNRTTADLAQSFISRNLKTANIEEDYGSVKRERECIMCLTEEMSVVFLPCAHLVVCLKCNELHEKQGMKECPSCRTVIQNRIPVRYSSS